MSDKLNPESSIVVDSGVVRPSVVAIDPGVVNYALAIRDTEGKLTVLRESIAGKTPRHICLNIRALLDRFSHQFTPGTVVLIERQMRVNPKMTALMNFTFAYFTLLFPLVDPRFYRASLKTTTFGMPTNLDKDDRKKTSVLWALSMLEDKQDFANLNQIKAMKKQDDVCDCILMIESFLETNRKKSEASRTKSEANRKKQKPRGKPKTAG